MRISEKYGIKDKKYYDPIESKSAVDDVINYIKLGLAINDYQKAAYKAERRQDHLSYLRKEIHNIRKAHQAIKSRLTEDQELKLSEHVLTYAARFEAGPIVNILKLNP